MNKQTEALKMAIADLELCNGAQTVEDIIIYTHEAIQACKEALAQPEVSDAELVSYRQGYEQGRFDYEMDLELGKIEQPARLVSYAPDKSTCTLNIDGEEVYFNREQPAQEPVAFIQAGDLVWSSKQLHKGLTEEMMNDKLALYLHPATSWQGLSDDEIHNYADYNFAFASEHFDEIFKFARAIEQALRERNCNDTK